MERPVQLRLFTGSLSAGAMALLLSFALSPGEASARVQKKDQQKCISNLNRGAAKMMKAVGGHITGCLKAVAKNNPTTSMAACVLLDPKNKRAKAQASLNQKAGGACEGGANQPDFGYTPPGAAGQASIDKELRLLRAVFGSDLDADVIVTKVDDKDGSQCQQAVWKALQKCQDTKMKLFGACKKNGLKGKVPPGLITSAVELQDACLGIGTDSIPDPKSKLPGKCLGGIAKAVDKKCSGLDLGVYFPGDGGGSIANLERSVECEVCNALNKIDVLERDCDLFDDGDPNNQSCESPAPGGCEDQQFDSTLEAIQAIIFDAPVYGCSTGICHGGTPGQGNLNLSVGSAHANLVGVPSTISPSTDRVEPGDPLVSVLYDKLQAAVHATLPEFGGSRMPLAGTPLTEAHLEAVELWIRGGAPEDLVVEGTAELLATCLPDSDPLIIPPPDPPGAGVGAQFWQTPWNLPKQSEIEICMSTYYDLTATVLVPDGAKIACAMGPGNNPSGECFQWHRQLLAQDPQSHHSIIHLYAGNSDTTDPAWGSWTYKFQDPTNPLNGQTCDPTQVDPNTGYHRGCSSTAIQSIACIGYGPADNTAFFSSGFSGSQEPIYDQSFADTVYAPLPMAGIIIWNSHAFNRTLSDTTMSQYLNLDFAEPADQLNEVKQIFDASNIFIMNVPPFQAIEYCGWYRIPQGSNLFHLASHTHRHGVHFRIWEPPNGSCFPGSGGGACMPGDPNQLVYESFDYSDPIQLVIDPPDFYGNVSGNERRFLYCSLYDNGSTPESPPVKRNSDPLGGCGVEARACMDGPNKGVLCGGNNAFCETSPGAGDGECDACPVIGGVTTEDDMFIMLGFRY